MHAKYTKTPTKKYKSLISVHNIVYAVHYTASLLIFVHVLGWLILFITQLVVKNTQGISLKVSDLLVKYTWGVLSPTQLMRYELIRDIF